MTEYKLCRRSTSEKELFVAVRPLIVLPDPWRSCPTYFTPLRQLSHASWQSSLSSTALIARTDARRGLAFPFVGLGLSADEDLLDPESFYGGSAVTSDERYNRHDKEAINERVASVRDGSTFLLCRSFAAVWCNARDRDAEGIKWTTPFCSVSRLSSDPSALATDTKTSLVVVNEAAFVDTTRTSSTPNRFTAASP